MTKHTGNSPAVISRLANRLKDLLFVQPMLPYWRETLNGKLMVYLYHRIGEEGEFPYLDQGGSPIISEQEFRQDLRFLQAQGAQFIRFCDISESIFGGKTFSVIICNDDGFASNYRAGLDILTELSIPATIFQCSAMIDSDTLIWEHQLYWLIYNDEYGDIFCEFIHEKYPDWPSSCDAIRESIHPKLIQAAIDKLLLTEDSAVRKMRKQAALIYPSIDDLKKAEGLGHEIGSHGSDHFKRSNISTVEFKNELMVSYNSLANLLTNPPASFSYPFNSHNHGDDAICGDLYNFIATVDGGTISKQNDFYNLPRNTWPGEAKNTLRHRRWLLTGHI